MTCKFTAKNIRIPDAEINKSMKILGLTKDEAIQMWLEDEGYLENAVVEELTAKAKENKINHEARATKSEKKVRKPREKKENLTKKQIIAAIREGLDTYMPGISRLDVTNDEKYIEIDVDGKHFTVNLVQHRVKKT
jgi:hypothetical protein